MRVRKGYTLVPLRSALSAAMLRTAGGKRRGERQNTRCPVADPRSGPSRPALSQSTTSIVVVISAEPDSCLAACTVDTTQVLICGECLAVPLDWPGGRKARRRIFLQKPDYKRFQCAFSSAWRVHSPLNAPPLHQQTHPECAGVDSCTMLQAVVRLCRVSRRSGDAPAREDIRDGVHVQEVSEGVPQEHGRVRRERRVLPALRQPLRESCVGFDGPTMQTACPPCQVIEAKTPQAVIGVEGDDPRIDARWVCAPLHEVRRAHGRFLGC